MSNKKIPIQFRQGDVLLERIEAFPSLTLTKAKSPVLAEGEVGGHGHVMVGEAEVFFASTNLFVKINGESSLQHQILETGAWTGEHHEIVLPKGIYKVIQQVEFDPYKRIITNIRD